MLLNVENIIRRIQSTGYIVWSLYLVKSGFDKVHIHSYSVELKDNDVSNEKNIDASISMLNAVLSEFPEGSKFQITLKKENKSNGTGIIGPLDFKNGDKTEVNGLGTIPTNNNTDTEEIFKKQLELLDEKNKIAMQQFKMQIEKEAYEKSIAEREERLKESEASFNSGTAKIAKAIEIVASKLLGLSDDEPEQTSLEGSPREEIIQKIAAKMYESNLTEEQLQQIFINSMGGKHE